MVFYLYMLRIDGLTKRYGTLEAVSNVTCTIEPGTIFALIGPNGSGKTTLMRMMAGLLRPTAGDVYYGAASMRSAPLVAKYRLGYVPDNPETWGRLTGHEFLQFTGALYDIPLDERRRQIARLVPRFGLQEIEHVYFEQYSRGNRQKFAILAALLHKPDVLLIDEPIVGLDPDSVVVLETLLKEFAAGGGIVVMTTHTLTVADRVAERVGILERGCLRATDTIAGLRRRYDLLDSASLADIYRQVVTRPAYAVTTQ